MLLKAAVAVLIACCVVSTHALLDEAPPVISLHMIDSARQTEDGSYVHIISQPSPAIATDAHARICEVLEDTQQTCALPVARAWDHHDGDLSNSVRTNITLVTISPPRTEPIATAQNVQNVDYNVRAEYLLEYDVEDHTGNVAERAYFAMVMQDTEPPTLSEWDVESSSVVSLGANITVEACDGWQQYAQIPLPSATDNYDQDVSDTVCASSTEEGTVCASQSDERTSLVVDSRNDGVVRNYTITAHDFAGSLGLDGSNNVVTVNLQVVVEDTQPPRIFCDAPDTMATRLGQADRAETFNSTIQCGDAAEDLHTHECGITFAPPQASCFDMHDSWTAIGTPAIPLTVAVESTTVAQHLVNDLDDAYPVTYTCTDASGNVATQQRRVHVTDTLAPTLIIGTDLVVQARGAADVNNMTVGEAASWTCDDMCDASGELTMQYDLYTGGTCGGGSYTCINPDTGMEMECDGSNAGVQRIEVELDGDQTNYDSWDTLPAATYGLRYTCTDKAGNSAARCRTVELIPPPNPPGPYNLPILGEFFVVIMFQKMSCVSVESSQTSSCLDNLIMDIESMKADLLNTLEVPNPDNINVQWTTPAGTQATNAKVLERRLEQEEGEEEDQGLVLYELRFTVFAKGGPCRGKALQSALTEWSEDRASEEINRHITGGPVDLGVPILYNALIVNTDESDEGIQNATNAEEDLFKVPDTFDFLQDDEVYMIVKLGNWAPTKDLKALGEKLGPIVSEHLEIPIGSVALSRVEARFTDEDPPRLDTWVHVSVNVKNATEADVIAAGMNGGCTVENYDLDRAIHSNEITINSVTGRVEDPTFEFPGSSCLTHSSLAWKIFNGTDAEMGVQTLDITTPPTYSEVPPYCDRPIISAASGSNFVMRADESGGHFTLPEDVQCNDPYDKNIDERIVLSTNDPLEVPRDVLGNYEYNYNCRNWLVVPAKQFTRHIQVYDGYCPICELPDEILYVEASFPYIPEALSCQEPLENITFHQETITCDALEGDGQVPELAADCVNTEMTGTYVYTYHIVDEYGNANDDEQCGDKRSYVRTVIVEDTMKPVISLAYTGSSTRRLVGLETKNRDATFDWKIPLLSYLSLLALLALVVCAAMKKYAPVQPAHFRVVDV